MSCSLGSLGKDKEEAEEEKVEVEGGGRKLYLISVPPKIIYLLQI